MAGWWRRTQNGGPRRFVALAVLAFVVAGCSGPDDQRLVPTATASVLATADPPTVTATRPASAGTTATPVPADPTATRPPASPTSSPTVAPADPSCGDGVALLGVTDALDKSVIGDDVVGGLSGLAWTGDGAVYHALSDRGARVYTLDLAVLDNPDVIAEFRLRDAAGEPDSSIDGEGLAVLPNGDLLASSEAEPSIRRFTPDGQYLVELPVPDRFLVQPAGRASGNGTFESLALSPSGQHLFTAVEKPLDGDGETDADQSRIRILRYDLVDGAFEPAAEYLYLTEPAQSVSEIAAISDTEVLVLERGLSLLSGFSARVFSVTLDGADNVSTIDRLEESDARPVTKELLVDIADCPSPDGAPSGNFNPLLENFESMAFGPPQPDGRRTLILGSDDNFESFQVTRFLVIAIDPGRL